MSAESLTFFVTFNDDDREQQVFWTENAKVARSVHACDDCHHQHIEVYDRDCKDRGDEGFGHVVGNFMRGDDFAELRFGRKMLRFTGTVELVDIPGEM